MEIGHGNIIAMFQRWKGESKVSLSLSIRNGGLRMWCPDIRTASSTVHEDTTSVLEGVLHFSRFKLRSSLFKEFREKVDGSEKYEDGGKYCPARKIDASEYN
jgi:hypothetical protein